MATTERPIDQRLRDGTTWYIISSQSEWWLSRLDGWTRRKDMRLAHKLHTLGWLEDHAQDILSKHAAMLMREAPDALFSSDLVAEAEFLQDNAASDHTARVAVQTTPFYQRLLHDIVTTLGTGLK
jgi:hypothetical protein